MWCCSMSPMEHFVSYGTRLGASRPSALIGLHTIGSILLLHRFDSNEE